MFNRMNRDYGIRFFIVLLIGWLSFGWIDPMADKIRDGNQSYLNGKYDEAYGKYAEIQATAPGIPQVDFNMADALYKKGKFDEAARLFQKAAGADNTGLKAKSSYNIGNTLYKQGKMKESLEWYKKALDAIDEAAPPLNNDLDALRNDAKYNYEYVDKKMKEMEQKKQDEEQKEDEQQEKEEKEQSGKNDENNRKDQEPPKENDTNKAEDQQQKEQDKKEQTQRPEEKKQKEPADKQQQLPQNHEQKQMTKEAAERLLDAINQSEKEARNVKKEEQKLQHRSVEKDW